jgi:hypothetical protein
MLSRLYLFVLIFLIMPTAHAWGPEGHAIVADIAENNLTAVAQTKIQALLALEGHQNLDDISSWADQIRTDDTAAWHFVDIPLPASQYRYDRDCDQDKCVVAMIVHFANQLNDPGQDKQTHLEALKWLVHFVGDIHQPLHAANDDDHGGNDVKLTFFGKQTNLHRIWDSAIIEKALNLHLGPHYTFDHNMVKSAAKSLESQITADEHSKWMQAEILQNISTTTAQWAEESHAHALLAYDQLPEDFNRNWSKTYENVTWPVVQTRLQKAGLRLAELLNEILR